MSTNEFDLARFLAAQKGSYAEALSELRAGKKRSHWIWWVFPQLKGLGLSSTSEIYGLSGLDEARAYLADQLLAQRLKEAVNAMLAHSSSSAASILGELDAFKFRSCLTLFSLAAPSEKIFADALAQFFDGERDARTIELLQAQGEA
jgi:uncharacterized protein (DUF1810 family)